MSLVMRRMGMALAIALGVSLLWALNPLPNGSAAVKRDGKSCSEKRAYRIHLRGAWAGSAASKRAIWHNHKFEQVEGGIGTQYPEGGGTKVTAYWKAKPGFVICRAVAIHMDGTVENLTGKTQHTWLNRAGRTRLIDKILVTARKKRR